MLLEKSRSIKQLDYVDLIIKYNKNRRMVGVGRVVC